MNDEETKILHDEELNKSEEQNNKKGNSYEKAAYAGGGFAAGVAVGVGGSAFASNPSKTEAKEETQQETVVDDHPDKEEVHAHDTPDPEEILLATDEGIKVAQVDDSASFSEAFADARAQVGPGGVFEWNGQVYNTYYEEEWANMSAAERAEFHHKIDYSTIMGTDSSSAAGASHASHTTQDTHTSHTAQDTHASETAHASQTSEASHAAHASHASETSHASEDVPSNTEMVDDSGASDEIKVLGVESVVDDDGNQGTIAGIEVDGQQAILVDVDNDGTMDLIASDMNGNGQLDDFELQDISQANIETSDLEQMMAAQQGDDVYYASNDDMPDYVNNADISSLA